MPTNITGTDTFTDPVVGPADGDAQNAASVNTALQALANRTTYTKSRIDEGVKLIRTVSTSSALKALTGMAHGELAIAMLTNTPRGLFRFVSGFVDTEINNYVFPADNSSGTWYSLDYLNDVLNGAPKIRTVASKVALKALTGMGDGEARFLHGGTTDTGLFIFKSGATLSPDQDYGSIALRADNASGVWFNALVGNTLLTGGAGGNSPRLSLGVPNGTLGVVTQIATSSNLPLTANGSFQDSTFNTGAMALQVGDLVEVLCSFPFSTDTATSADIEVKLVVHNGTSDSDVSGAKLSMQTSGAGVTGATWPVTLLGSYTAAVAANHTFKLHVKATSGNSISVLAPRQFRVTAIRP